MRWFGFIFVMCPTKKILSHKELKINKYGGDIETLTKANFNRILTIVMMDNDTRNKYRLKYKDKKGKI